MKNVWLNQRVQKEINNCFTSEPIIICAVGMDNDIYVSVSMTQIVPAEFIYTTIGVDKSEGSDIAVWDFNTVLGDTIKEKHESLYVKVVEVENLIHRQEVSSRWDQNQREIAVMQENQRMIAAMQENK